MVMPLWDDSPLKLPKWPVVTWGLIVLNVAVFIVESVAPHYEYVAMAFAMTPGNITGTPISPPLVPPYLTLVTSQFLHADIFHLLGNMVFLAIFGDDVEEAMGSLRFIVFYLACGILAALAFIASSPHSIQPLVGASGAIAGVLAAYLMFRPCQKVLVFIPYFIVWFVLRPVARLDAYWVLGGWAVIQLWHVSVQSHDGVAYMAHIGGFIAGAILFLLLRYRTVRLFECIRAEAAP
ncbi:MAG: rhomboid family intramembrane serine protease [Rhizobiales bacterium]|nr:rhomboid family intramembrane serine protease [Hyphomicrobiales bacterium]